MHGVLALIMAIFLANQAAAGAWTPNSFIYKPALGARGQTEKNSFDDGLDRVDGHLGKYKTLGDPGHATLSEALSTIGSTETTLALPAGTVNITSNTSIPTNVHLKMLRGGKFNISTGVTLTINGPFEAGLYQTFSWTGTGKVVFGHGAVDRAYPEWWGAKPDYNPANGTGTDSANAINAALAAAKRVHLQAGNYYFTKALYIPVLTQLVGQGVSHNYEIYEYSGTRLYPAKTGGTWINGHCVAYNTTDGSTWVNSYPSMGGMIKDFSIEGYHHGGYTDAKAIIFAGAFHIERVTAYKMKGGIKRTNNYADHVIIKYFTSGYSQAASGSYEIDLAQVGDGLVIESCHVIGPAGGSSGVRVSYCGGGVISSNIFNCDQTYEFNRSLTVQNTHSEGGVVSVKNSNMSFRDNQFKRKVDGPAVTVTADGNGVRGHVVFDNCDFMQWPDQDFTTNQADIDYSGAAVTIRNCRRKYENGAGYVDMKMFSGIQVNYDGAPLAAFNNYSHEYSNYAELKSNGVIPRPWTRVLTVGGGAFYPFSWAGTSGHVTWRDSSGTYYYRGQILACPVRKVGVTGSNEVSGAVTNGGNGMLFIIGGFTQYLMEGVILRLYRGASSNSYNRYVDVPLSNWNRYLADDGHAVNGYVWQNRTAGAADSVVGTTQIESAGDLVRVVHTGTPTVGSWSQGDFVQKKDLAGNATPGWYCISAGTPGTWKAMANLAN